MFDITGFLTTIILVLSGFNKVLNNSLSKLITNSDKKITSDEFWHYYYGKSHNPHGFYWSSCGGTGQVLDVIMDLLGYITGSYIASYYNS